jgi:hypothetical protein
MAVAVAADRTRQGDVVGIGSAGVVHAVAEVHAQCLLEMIR